jgi:nucleotide-binding universal stress UspA family protein
MNPFQEQPLSSTPGSLPIVRSVLHPTDLAPDSEIAFQHALAIALLRQTSLTLLHVEGSSRGGELPSVREMLERWGLLEEGSSRSAVYENFKVRIKKKVVKGRPLPVILKHIEQGYVDLVVVATRGSGGGWLKPSVSEPLAHRSDASTLFVPVDSPGMVDPSNGQLTIRKILVPVAEVPDAQNAVTLAARTAIAAHEVHGDPVELHLTHVGDEMPGLQLPQHDGIEWSQSLQQGDVIDRIIEIAGGVSADLVVMASDGRNGILDAFRGSHSEQIVRQVPCPLLVVPITAHEMPLLLT